MKILFLILVILGMLSCNNMTNNGIETNSSVRKQIYSDSAVVYQKLKQPLHNRSTQIDNKTEKGSTIISTFTTLPKEIEGCTCYFFLSKMDEKQGKYLFAGNFSQTGYFPINGKMEKFDLINFKDDTLYIYSNQTDTLKIEFKKKVNTGSEEFDVEGLLRLTHNNIVIQRNFVGSCGC